MNNETEKNTALTSSDENNTKSSAPADRETDKKALSDSEVTAHTSSMWKYKPIPESPEKYPEYMRSRETDPDGRITVTAARVRGKMHKHDGTNCDDWYKYDFGGGMVFAAVADGAGSKIFSRIGAKISCETAVASMKESFTDYFNSNSDASADAAKSFDDPAFNKVCSEMAGFIRKAASDAAAAVSAEAEKRSDDKTLIEAAGRNPVLSDFSSTLLLAAVIPVLSLKTGNVESLIMSVQIGDGMIAAVDANADYSSALGLMGAADSGDFSGETDFITSPRMKTPEVLMSRTRITRRPCTDLLMMTDGVADDYFPNDPGLLRLYMDLIANEIIPSADCAITDNNRPYISKIPRPQKSVWVNDNDVSYDIQYTSAVCEAAGLSPEQLWNSPDVAAAASLRSFGADVCPDAAAQLERWLDNYVRRGSFDDRTLLIITIGDAGKGQLP